MLKHQAMISNQILLYKRVNKVKVKLCKLFNVKTMQYHLMHTNNLQLYKLITIMINKLKIINKLVNQQMLLNHLNQLVQWHKLNRLNNKKQRMLFQVSHNLNHNRLSKLLMVKLKMKMVKRIRMVFNYQLIIKTM